MFNSISMIGVGIACRGPAAAFFRRDPGQRSIRVGCSGALAGRSMGATSIAPLHERGIDANEHRARQREPSTLCKAVLSLAMERRHLGSVARLAPEASGNTFLFDQRHNSSGVPHGSSLRKFQQVHASIERGVGSWLRYL